MGVKHLGKATCLLREGTRDRALGSISLSSWIFTKGRLHRLHTSGNTDTLETARAFINDLGCSEGLSGNVQCFVTRRWIIMYYVAPK